ncbi:MAG: hypothetical protein ABMA64_03305 [Myxococcota bacterium]
MYGKGWLGVTLVVSLGCGGLLGPDPERIEALDAALGSAEPAAVLDPFLLGSVEARSVGFGCARAVEAAIGLAPSDRATMFAYALSDWKQFCPPSCVSDLEPLATMEPDARLAAVIGECDAAGPDPVFGGPLAPLRTAMSPLDYLMVRALAERADAAHRGFAERHRVALAIGLVSSAPPALPPSSELQARGTRAVEPAALAGLQAAVAACGPEAMVAHRVVLDPAGAVLAVVGPEDRCVRDALAALALPSPDGSYAAIDLTWKPRTPAPE